MTRESRWETISWSVQNTVVIPPLSSIFALVTMALPYTRETVFLHRMNLHSDRGTPANTNEEPIFSKLAMTSSPAGRNWANFIQPRTLTPTAPATISTTQQICCNTLKDWVGKLQLKPTTSYLCAFAVDNANLNNGDTVVLTANFLFEVIDLN